MPVRSLNSPVLKWPDRATVERALKTWSERLADEHDSLEAVGLFGSYARGDWGVGSDVDLVAIVTDNATRFEQRASAFDTLSLPVPAELLVYTRDEWQAMLTRTDRWARMLRDETVWVFTRRGFASRTESA